MKGFFAYTSKMLETNHWPCVGSMDMKLRYHHLLLVVSIWTEYIVRVPLLELTCNNLNNIVKRKERVEK